MLSTILTPERLYRFICRSHKIETVFIIDIYFLFGCPPPLRQERPKGLSKGVLSDLRRRWGSDDKCLTPTKASEMRPCQAELQDAQECDATEV